MKFIQEKAFGNSIEVEDNHPVLIPYYEVRRDMYMEVGDFNNALEMCRIIIHIQIDEAFSKLREKQFRLEILNKTGVLLISKV